jgi:exosortase/archaeosortase
MKKEYLWYTLFGLFIFGFVLNKIAGPIQPGFRNPYQFLNPSALTTYPFSAVGIAAYAIAVAGSLMLAFSYLSKSYYFKAAILFVFAALAQLYAIQQLATRSTVTPTEWTLAIAFAGVLFLPFVVFLIFQGIFTSAHRAIVKEITPVRPNLKEYKEEPQPEGHDKL